MSILRFLGLSNEQKPSPETDTLRTPETDTLRKIASELDRLPPEQARFLAGFAYILSRVARADLKISEEETRAMEGLVSKTGRLPEEQAILVVQMAKTQNLLFGATENFLVTREFNKTATREQKLDLLRCLFAVAAADQSISGMEDNVARQIARELNLEHSDYISVRSEFRDKLSVLQESRHQKVEPNP